MLDKIPDRDEMITLVGKSLYEIWNSLCALYAKEDCISFMVILGKDERIKFENNRGDYSNEVQKRYDAAKTYHDGKWIAVVFIALLLVSPLLARI